MAKLTRLATTVTARYYSSSDLTDAFYLDGRLSGKREARSADVTIDKEDRGFFFSVFSHATVPGRDPSAEPPFAAPLRKLYNDIKSGRKALDDEIGELVNTAVAVTGRMKLQTDNSRSPFFAGVMVKDTEAFAITMGKGLAFLYRDDTLFPLTATDLPIEPVNTQKQKVDNFYNYCATKTATALCSNIAQLKMDDCIILCNREIYDALGQHEILRILFESEDQCEAAGLVITEAAAKLPGVPLQIMIAFVENVTAQEKPGFFGFGKKKNQQSYNEVEDDAIEIPIVTAATTVASAASTVIIEPVASAPLFFGNEPTDPFVQPLAEKPVDPTGPDDPIHFKDEELKPFGDPVAETEPTVDEGGFLKPETDAAASDGSSKVKASEAVEVSEPSQSIDMTVSNASQAEDESDITFTADSPFIANPFSNSDANYTQNSGMNSEYQTPSNTPQYLPDEPDFGDDQSLVFGDDHSSSNIRRQVPASAPYGTSSKSQPPPQDMRYGGSSMYGQTPPSTDIPTGSPFYIPFESREQPSPKRTDINDIPDMPIYDAPTYSPPTYPTNSYTPTGYDNAGVYARGSYSIDDEEDDVRRDIPPQISQSTGSYSYTPPQKTMPSYGSSFAGDPRMTQSSPQRPFQSPQQTGYAPPNRQQHTPQDMFDQEQGFDYGQTDSAYKRNRLLMLILAGVCLICFIVLLSVWATSCNEKNNDANASKATPTPIVSPTISPTPTGVTTAPTNPLPSVTPEKLPIGVFRFSDQTGYRTWWDLFHYVYGIDIESDTDPRISQIITYNGREAGYLPAPGDGVLLPPLAMFTT
jgi:hypothetical protein